MSEPTIGARIRARRESQGKSLVEIAEACGVTEATVSRWETGQIEMLWRNVVAVSKALGVSVGALVSPRSER